MRFAASRHVGGHRCKALRTLPDNVKGLITVLTQHAGRFEAL
jgi:hypothetical protein